MRIDPKLIEEGYIKCTKHPIYDLYIYNYTSKCQIEKKWNEDTLKCRGLILDDQGKVIARPFKKFFNYEEIQYSDYVPNLKNSIAFEKMDGSLGIFYQVNNEKFLATRGSFSSEQAIEGTIMLRQNWPNVKFLSQYTYLFEIIYPENRIVVDYHGKSKLVLLSIIDNMTGKDLSWEYILNFARTWRFEVPQTYGFSSYEEVKNIKTNNFEGFVFLCEDGTRVKVKLEEYKRLHRIVTGVSTKSIWECLSNNLNIQEYIYSVPDEFSQWVIKKRDELFEEYRNICQESENQIHLMSHAGCSSMKEMALFIEKHPYKSVIFAMLRNHDYSKIVWKMIEPKYEQPFKEIN